MTPGEWVDDMLPDWHDHGSKVEVEWDDGSRMTGVLEYEDFTPGPDEWPIYFVEAEDGSRKLIGDMKRWRKLSG